VGVLSVASRVPLLNPYPSSDLRSHEDEKYPDMELMDVVENGECADEKSERNAAEYQRRKERTTVAPAWLMG
jgi:hypothetical protein